jgi:hypothetical protein
MKPILNLILIHILLTTLHAFAQYDDQSVDPIIEEQIAEEGSFQSEFIPPSSDEVPVPGQIEEQEEMLYPPGEETDWGFGSEELAAEEFE